MRKHLFVLLLPFLCFFTIHNLLAADIESIGGPYVQNYSKSAYSSGNQNWSIAKDKKGMMYFANAEGLLTYDGKFWEKYKMPNRQVVRSVAVGNDGKVYTGSFGEFGYWDIRDNKFVYNSLVNLIPKKYGLKDEVWKIYIDESRVIFQSFSSIYIYQNNRIEVVKGPSSFLFLHKVQNRFFVEVINKGLFELKGNELLYIKNSDKLGTTGILSILPFKNDQLIIGTGKNGLFIYDGSDFKKLQTPANTFLETFQLNNGAKIQNKYYAYGTILNGIIIIDESGRVVQRINKSSGLQNNTILSLYADNEQNLWAGLDNGIDRIELNSPLYFYFDKTGQFGTVYSSIISNNKIYLGTNQGLFYSDWQSDKSLFKSFNFKLIPNSQGQVWDLSKLDGELICGHNDGTFKVVDDHIEKISEINGGWTIKKLLSNPDFALQGTYTGLALFSKNKNGNWNFDSKINGFSEPSKYVEQESSGDIWISHAYKGLYKLKLSPDFKNVISKKYFDGKQGLPGNYNVNIFKLENRIVFSSDSGFYTFDGISNRFSKYEVLNKKLGSFASSNKIIDAGSKKYWFINHGKTALVTFPDPGKIAVDSSSFSILDGRMVQYYENVNRISNSIYLISVDDGFVIYNASQNVKNTEGTSLPKVLIRKIEDITDRYS
ncbi:MAG: transcriptional regulator, partial [Daejeonella sp.]